MTLKNSVICDTDFLISLHVTNESTHQKALELFEKLSANTSFIISNLTKYELATVLSRKFDHVDAVEILQTINENFDYELWFEKEWQSETFKIYTNQTKKSISFFDCACFFLAQKFNFKIASFDKFYPKELLIS